MAAVDLSATSSFPFIKVISSVGTTQQEVNLPPGKLRVSVGSDVEVLLATSGVSDEWRERWRSNASGQADHCSKQLA
jgi:hypothetical protein